MYRWNWYQLPFRFIASFTLPICDTQQNTTTMQGATIAGAFIKSMMWAKENLIHPSHDSWPVEHIWKRQCPPHSFGNLNNGSRLIFKHVMCFLSPPAVVEGGGMCFLSCRIPLFAPHRDKDPSIEAMPFGILPLRGSCRGLWEEVWESFLSQHPAGGLKSAGRPSRQMEAIPLPPWIQ